LSTTGSRLMRFWSIRCAASATGRWDSMTMAGDDIASPAVRALVDAAVTRDRAAVAELGVGDGDRATLETPYGRCDVLVTLDAAIPPGVVEVAARPGILDICAPGTRAKVVRV